MDKSLDETIELFDKEKDSSSNVGETFISGEVKLQWKADKKSGVPAVKITAKEVTKNGAGEKLTRTIPATHKLAADEPERNEMVKKSILKSIELFLEDGTIL